MLKTGKVEPITKDSKYVDKNNIIDRVSTDRNIDKIIT